MKSMFLRSLLALAAAAIVFPCLAETPSALAARSSRTAGRESKAVLRRVRPANVGSAMAERAIVSAAGPERMAARGAETHPDQGPKPLQTRAAWVPLVNQMPDTNDSLVTPGAVLLLTDGTVLAQDSGTADWWRLTPDQFGSYVNGTWIQAASMPYAPLYFASAVLPDGRVLVEGGEYVDFVFTWTNQGAIYDPVTDTWQSIAPPAGWATIGDAQSVVLANGTLMLANALTAESALFDASTLTWSITGSGKADINDEEGWTLLSSGKVLTVDANNFSDITHSELYDPALGAWSFAGSTGVSLVDIGPGSQSSHEIGPQVLRPDGTVIVAGATGHTAIYDSKTGAWAAGPDFPSTIDGQLDVADGPAALLPNGNVLIAASPGIFQNGTRFFEFDGRRLTEAASRPDAADASSFSFYSLILPTGEILVNNSTSGIGAMVYTGGGAFRHEWAPEISSVPRSLHAGASYQLMGERLNGLSQGAGYGDDSQSATNYPLVRITNQQTGHVFFARTHDHSSMAVGLQTHGSTQFDVPAGIETGPSQLTVVTNGIPSESVRVTIAP